MKALLFMISLSIGNFAFAAPKGYKDCSCPGKTERCVKTVKCNDCCKGASGSGTKVFGEAFDPDDFKTQNPTPNMGPIHNSADSNKLKSND